MPLSDPKRRLTMSYDGSSGSKVNVFWVNGPPMLFGANEFRFTVPKPAAWSPICV